MKDLSAREWLTLIHRDYLQQFVRNGGSAVKIVVGETPQAGPAVKECLAGLAEREGYAFVHVDARDTKVHMMDRLFHHIARSTDWDDLAYRFVARLLIEHGYHVPEDRAQFRMTDIAALNGRAEPLLRRDLNAWLERAIFWDPHMSQEFRFAMIRLCLAQLDPGETSPFLTDAVHAWLRGELRQLSALKDALIFQKVVRHNARHLLASFTHWLRLVGKNGLVLTLDLARYLVAKRPEEQAAGWFYSAAAAMDVYEVLRQFIDGTDDIEGLLLVGLVPPEFLSDARRGLSRYEALKLRIWDDVRDRHRQNPLSALVRLTASGEEAAAIADSSPDAPILVQRNVFHERVIEALRAGVPNKDVVQALGSHQPEIEGQFRRMLGEIEANTCEAMSGGLVIEGGFGTGKSHMLEALQQIAVEQNFVCSHIVISKETPFYNIATMFRAAVESAVVPNKRGDAITEIAGELNFQSPQYAEFYEWVHRPASGMDSRFAATVHLYEHLVNDPELSHRMVRFWAGDPLGNGELKKYLQGSSSPGSYTFAKIAVQELALQRFKFVAQLVRAAGYRGWVLLIDEAEIMARYSFKQRAKSYRELARWMGALPQSRMPGLGAVIAITDDFAAVMFEEKGDREKIVRWQTEAGSEDLRALAREAGEGIRQVDERRTPLDRPYEKLVEETYDKVRVMHSSAYQWEAPPLAPGEQLSSTRMREYVRGWITEWDLRRLYPGEIVELEFTGIQHNYAEDVEFETVGEGESLHGDTLAGDETTLSMVAPHRDA